ncbi:MAG: hypothetical protein QXS54_12470 [Candidatus Methanomethylicaceae archaeon]
MRSLRDKAGCGLTRASSRRRLRRRGLGAGRWAAGSAMKTKNLKAIISIADIEWVFNSPVANERILAPLNADYASLLYSLNSLLTSLVLFEEVYLDLNSYFRLGDLLEWANFHDKDRLLEVIKPIPKEKAPDPQKFRQYLLQVLEQDPLKELILRKAAKIAEFYDENWNPVTRHIWDGKPRPLNEVYEDCVRQVLRDGNWLVRYWGNRIVWGGDPFDPEAGQYVVVDVLRTEIDMVCDAIVKSQLAREMDHCYYKPHCEDFSYVKAYHSMLSQELLEAPAISFVLSRIKQKEHLLADELRELLNVQTFNFYLPPVLSVVLHEAKMKENVFKTALQLRHQARSCRALLTDFDSVIQEGRRLEAKKIISEIEQAFSSLQGDESMKELSEAVISSAPPLLTNLASSGLTGMLVELKTPMKALVKHFNEKFARRHTAFLQTLARKALSAPNSKHLLRQVLNIELRERDMERLKAFEIV